jgi:hypothetical protein
MVIKEEGTYGGLQVLNMPEGTANIFSMPELEKVYRITYDSWEGYYVVHTAHGEVRFYKDEQGLPYIDLTKSQTRMPQRCSYKLCARTMKATPRRKSSKPRKPDKDRV